MGDEKDVMTEAELLAMLEGADTRDPVTKLQAQVDYLESTVTRLDDRLRALEDPVRRAALDAEKVRRAGGRTTFAREELTGE